MESKKINQLATEMTPTGSDLTIIGDPITGVSRKITLLQLSATIGTGADLQGVTDNGATTTNPIAIGGLTITGLATGVLKSDSGVISSVPFGAANGVATLGGDGKVPSIQLPSYVDDVVEVANFAALPVTGETGKIYITLDNNKVYRWTGSIYVEIAANNAVWGAITGTLSNQTDLQNALNLKANDNAVVHLAGTETITGSKTFSVTTIQDAGIVLKDGVYPTPQTGYVGFASNGVGITIVRRSGGTSYNNNFQFPLASNDYNFPNATGTIALTSDIPSLTGYVPYTGATANVNLGTFDLTADVITGATGSFASSGGSDTFAINHSSGSGIALNITKGGNGEGLYINKTSGSGNAATIIGTLNATTLVKNGGTSSQFLKADGSVDASAYITLTSLSAGTGISYNNTTGVITNSAPDQTVSLTAGAGISISGTYPSFTIASTITQYTDALARAAISLTTTGTSGAATYNSTTGVFNIPNYAPDLSGYVPTSRTITINGTSFDLSANRTYSVGTVTSVGLSSATSGVTIGSTPITTSGTITLAIATASGSQNGLLSSTDWTTFNNKQSALTNPVTGTGTTNYLPKFTGASTIGNSLVFDNGTSVGINQASPTRTLDILGASGIGTVLKLQGASGTTTYLQMAYNGATNAQSGYIGYNSSSQMQFFTNDTVALTIDSNRNLGLGVTPSAWATSFRAFDILQQSSIAAENDAFNITLNAYYDTSWKYKATGKAQRYVQYDGGYYWNTAPSGTAGNAITFTQAMTLTAAGNLGVGTTSPLRTISLPSNSYIGFGAGNGTRPDFQIGHNSAEAVLSIRAGFGSDDTDVCVTTGGNVLIGTTTDAGYKLDVSGTSRFAASYTSSGSVAIQTWQRVGGAVSADMTYNDANTSMNFGTSTSHTLNIKTNNTTALSIASTGAATFSSSVSVGSSLTVGTSSLFNGDMFTYQNGGIFFAGSGNYNSGIYGRNTGNDLAFNAGSSEKMRITSGGNVGIGTSSPQSIVHAVQSNSTAPTSGTTPSGYALSYGAGDGNNGGIWFSTDFGGDQGIAGIAGTRVSGYQTDLRFYTNNTNSARAFTERMRITSGGKVNINNTSNTNYQLYVDGGSSPAFAAYSTSANNQFKLAGTAPGLTITNTITSPTIGGALGACTSANDFITGTAAGDMILINQYTGNKLYITNYSGGVYLTQGATSWTANSDIRIKNINSHITNAVEKLSTLQTINFCYKDDISKKENLGLIAQEVEMVFPELIETNNDGILGVRYTELIPVLIEAIKEQQEQIKELKLELDKIKNK